MTVPLAISAAGWTAIGAVGGALVGATAGGVIDWLLGLRRDRAEAKAGARLVAGDIAAAESQVAKAEETSEWWQFYGHPITGWPEYRAILAMRLSNEDFEAVAQAVTVLESLREKLPAGPVTKQQFELYGFVAVSPDHLTPIRREAAKAYNALARLAGHEPEGDLIQR